MRTAEIPREAAGCPRSFERLLAAQPIPPDTPFLVIDLDIVRERYAALRSALPEVSIYYAVKANPAPEVVTALIDMGSGLDVASRGEIDLCLRLGADPGSMSFGNTVKKERDIAYAAGRGIRMFTADSPGELEKIMRVTTAATVFVRIETEGTSADWPLSKKFGCSVAEALPLLVRASRWGFDLGVTFHVGSQQRDTGAWDLPLEQVGELFAALRRQGIVPVGVNLGGGLPSRYTDPVPPVEAYGAAIKDAVDRHLGDSFTGRLLIEPGRFLVGDAGVIEAEVVLISERDSDPGRRWVYLDIGLFNGLTESLGEAIRYRIQCPGRDGPTGPVVLAGPSCDSVDVLYQKHEYRLPLDLRIGDRIRFLATGAYTSSYSSVWFNGFDPLNSYFLP